MKITKDTCEFATKEGVSKEKAFAVGMAEKAKKFVDKGSEIYQGNVPDGAKVITSLWMQMQK